MNLAVYQWLFTIASGDPWVSDVFLVGANTAVHFRMLNLNSLGPCQNKANISSQGQYYAGFPVIE